MYCYVSSLYSYAVKDDSGSSLCKDGENECGRRKDYSFHSSCAPYIYGPEKAALLEPPLGEVRLSLSAVRAG